MSFFKVTQLLIAMLLASIALSIVVNADKTEVGTGASRRSDIIADKSQTTEEERVFKFDTIPGIGIASSMLEKAQLQLWLALGKSADDVLSTMKLTSVEGNTLANPKFQAWLKYVDDFNQKNPRESKPAAMALTSHYGDNKNGQARLSRILDAGMEDEHTKAIALKLYEQRLESWEKKNIPPLDVFNHLRLDEDNLLTSPLLAPWLKYAKEFHGRNPDKMSPMTTLSIRLNDGELEKVLENGLNSDRTKDIATKLKNELFAEWGAQKRTPDFLFENWLLLSLDRKAPSLSDPVLKIWIRFMDEFNIKHPGEKTTLFDTLRRHYHEGAIVDMLVDAKRDPTTKALAENLESLLLSTWLEYRLSPLVVRYRMHAGDAREILEKYEGLFKAKWSADF
ncbi:RXLR effector family protein, putative [Phytophthora infestans T30-4]|uniref:RXLR effector family protein, putative n=1 Tax=Phytophthora infestans (strain T30-4) TaxID=403677 RepID=D0P1G0_PHYIT|nr:RXLR effector family protein, putative [Phytophthora infestans T30-4]EEY54582.1 RXLR effector family protein, putative [Phytophthora infestans T30-4]|eukprot:XP_002895862.1 RXLR effector family protein, putative [Phytophthora infestans T30-4]